MMKEPYDTILTFMIILLICIIFIRQIRTYDGFEIYCDEKFGKGNWTVIEGGRENFPEYIGQVWKCVSNYTNGSESNGTIP